MADVKRDFDDDDGDLKEIDAEGKLGSSSGESDWEDDEPDEEMQLPDAWQGTLPDLWLVKLPKSLMEKWSTIKDPNITLAKIRVHKSTSDNNHNITLHLPEEPQYDTSGENPNFRLSVPIREIDNTYVFADQPKFLENGQLAPRNARNTKLVGRVRHKGAVIPQLDAFYEAKVKARGKQANLKTRMTARIDDKIALGGRLTGGNALNDPEALKLGKLNYKMLASGSSRNAGGINLSKRTPTGKKDTERFARMPRNELMDKLQMLFREKDAYSLKDLRAMTEQPADYLREILPMIAVSPKSGPNTNMWMLNDLQKSILENTRAGEAGANAFGDVKAEDVPKTEVADELAVLSMDSDKGDSDSDEEMSEVLDEV